MLVCGGALGVAATWLAVFHGHPQRVSNGPWKTNLAAGNTRSNAYSRAFVAVHGLFALNPTGAVYYTASVDGEGRALEGRCRYEIAGRDPDARWWSITAYGADEYLISNPAHRYSVSKTEIARDARGAFTVSIGGAVDGNNWIPAGSGEFSLTLRLYNPGPDVLRDPAHAVLPALKRVSCP